MAAPARTDPSVCPDAMDAIMVLVPCPSIPDDYRNLGGSDSGDGNTNAGHDGGDTAAGGAAGGGGAIPPDREDWVRRAREGVIREMEASAGMKGFGDSIVGEEVYAPWDWRDRWVVAVMVAFFISRGKFACACNTSYAINPLRDYISMRFCR